MKQDIALFKINCYCKWEYYFRYKNAKDIVEKVFYGNNFTVYKNFVKHFKIILRNKR